MTITNYDVNKIDWSKLEFIFNNLQSGSKEFLIKYISNYEREKNGASISLFNALVDIPEYNEIMKEFYQKSFFYNISTIYDTRISENTVKKVLLILGDLDENQLQTLSPLNLCLKIGTPIPSNYKEEQTLSKKKIEEKLSEIAKREEEEYLKKLETKILCNKKMEVRSYFKTCASILTYLNSFNQYNKFSKKEKYDISLLLGMYYYTDSNEDYNIKNEFIRIFSDVLSKKKLLDFVCVGDYGISNNTDYDLHILYSFKSDLEKNDILQTLTDLFGEKNSNTLINELCNYLNIDDDDLYNRLRSLIDSKKESISDEELESKYISLFKNKSINTVKIYNTASWVYNYLDKFEDSEYRNNPNKRRILSLLVACFLNNNEDTIYLESEGITLNELLKSTIHNTELLDKDFECNKDCNEKVVIYRLGDIPSDERVLKNLICTPDKDIEVLFIKLGKDINVVRRNITEGKIEKPKLSYQEEIELINIDKPMLDVTSYSSISSYGNNIMQGVNSAINEVLHIINEDTTNKKLEEVKSGVSSVYEEKLPELPKKKNGFLSWFNGESEVKQDKEIIIHFDYIKELEDKISAYASDIDKQIFVYDWIQKRNIAYAVKLKEYISLAEKTKGELIKNMPESNENDPSSVFRMQYYKTQYDLLESKIASLKTSYMTMLQHFMAVDNAIRAHSVSNDALRKVINDFIPLLSSNMLISAGLLTDKQANQIVKNIVDLTNNYLNNNLEDAKEILDSLAVLGLPSERISRIKIDLDKKPVAIEQAEDENNQLKLTL